MAVVNEPQRKKLFERFWKAGDFNIQNAVAVSRVFKLPNVIVKSRAESRHANSRVYHVRNERVSACVCKAAFLRIHTIINGRLN